MSDHTVEVTRHEWSLAKLAERRPITAEDRANHYDWRIVCSDPRRCPGWIECHEPHEVDGRSAADGPWDAEEADPWAEQDEFVFHGVLHEWRSGHDWTVAYDGCPVEGADTDLPDGIDTTCDGTYPVEVEWDDELVYLTLSKGADQ